MNLITVRRKSGLSFEVKVGPRRVTTDMPSGVGGRCKGFTPAELLAGSLGACIAAAVQEFCETSGITEGDVSVNLAFEILGKDKRVGAIAVDVEMPDGFPEEMLNDVRSVAEGAVICETLRHPPEVDVDIQLQHQRQSGLENVGAASA